MHPKNITHMKRYLKKHTRCTQWTHNALVYDILHFQGARLQFLGSVEKMDSLRGRDEGKNNKIKRSRCVFGCDSNYHGSRKLTCSLSYDLEQVLQVPLTLIRGVSAMGVTFPKELRPTRPPENSSGWTAEGEKRRRTEI